MDNPEKLATSNTGVTRRVEQVEQELSTVPESSVFSGVRVVRCFLDGCLSFCNDENLICG
jgi:hypothetical protein